MRNETVENYLKAIFQIESQKGNVSTTSLANWLGISAASVTSMIKKLSEKNLVHYQPYYGLTLASQGRKMAIQIVRRHRLIEQFLVQILDVPWDQVHDEAEKLEHALSEDLLNRIDALLRSPQADPHGAPIPNKEGVIPTRNIIPLTELQTGQLAIIAEVSDHNSALLRYLGKLGIYPGTKINLISKQPFGGPLTIELSGKEIILGLATASFIFVEKKPRKRIAHESHNKINKC